MWAWIGQRLSAVFALALVVYHYFDPINQRAQTLLIAFVVFHAAIGVRTILLDLGLDIRKHKAALLVALAIGLLAVTAGTVWNQ
jgi:succinate dehydrogenase/fumarate reductase cytochrome b subunit